GDGWIAELLGLDPHTVSKGRRQLLERDVERSRYRGRTPTPPKSSK
ncbi:hypothetical protein MNBD_GAMMA18-268, partial [hydrothermal vent metagenome]